MDWPRFARAADAVVVAVLVVWTQVSVWTAVSGALTGGRAAHAAIAAAATVPLFVRRHRPLPVLLVVLLGGWLHAELGGTSGALWFGLCLGMYALGAHGDQRSLVAGSVVVAAAVLALDGPRLLAGASLDEVLPAWFILAGLVGLGRWVRYRRVETDELAGRAEAAERDAAAQAAAAVADERARIARELHDLVAHSMGVIVIQAQAGHRLVERDPDAARAAFSAVETAGRQGLGEMRRLLGLLTGDQSPSVAPQPGLRELPDLVDRVRAAGVPVELDLGGELSGLPAGVDLAAYRIAQEALTNVLKHAGRATARVSVRHSGGVLDVEICDDGRGGGGDRSGRGHGLVGMRERVALYGGFLEAGAPATGGYRVHARLVVDGSCR